MGRAKERLRPEVQAPTRVERTCGQPASCDLRKQRRQPGCPTARWNQRGRCHWSQCRKINAFNGYEDVITKCCALEPGTVFLSLPPRAMNDFTFFSSVTIFFIS